MSPEARTDRRPEEWAKLAQAGDFVGALLAFVSRRDWVTFGELQDHFKPFMPVKGTQAIALDGDNLIAWVGMSVELTELVMGQMRAGKIFFHVTQQLTYLIDGHMLNMPVAKRAPPKGGFKQPHWVPICLRTVPHAEKRKRARA